MPMYKYSNNYSVTSGSLWNCYRDEVNDSANEVDDNDNKTNSNKTTEIIGSTPNDNSRLKLLFN